MKKNGLVILVLAMVAMNSINSFASTDQKDAIEIFEGPETATWTDEEPLAKSNIIYDQSLIDDKIIVIDDPEDTTTEEVIEEIEEVVNNNWWSEEDRQYLIMALTGECQNRSFDSQLKYGSVILNRVKSSRYPNTIKGVVTQRGQYSCFSDGNAYRTPTSTTIQAADWLLNNGSIFPDNVVYQSRGKQGSGVYEIDGGEYFCY